MTSRGRAIALFWMPLGAVSSLGLAAACVWWASAPLRRPPPVYTEQIAGLSATALLPPGPPRREPPRLSDEARTANLYSELFPPEPPPPPPEPPPPPPRVEARLVAISGAGPNRSAFVQLTADGRYMDVAAGDELLPEVTVTAVEAGAVVLSVRGEPLRLELPR